MRLSWGRLIAIPVLLCCWAAAWSAPRSIRVVSSRHYPPYIFLSEDGVPQGYIVDVWRLWEKKTGIHVELIPMEWSDAQNAVLQGRADVIDKIMRTPKRDAYFDFSGPYASTATAIYADPSIRGIHDVQTLRGFLVGVEASDACVQHLQSAGIENISEYPNYTAMLEAAQAGSIKVFCMDESPASYYLYLNRMHFNLAFTFYSDDLRWAVRKGDTATYEVVAHGMARITPAERAELEHRWLSQPIEYRPYWKTVRIVMVIVLSAVGLLLFWIWSLRKAAFAKTKELREKNTELEAEKAELRAIFESSPDAMWVKDRSGAYRECNAAALRILGADRETAVGRTSADFLLDESVQKSVLEHDRQVLETGNRVHREMHMTIAGEGERVLEVALAPVRLGDDLIAGILGIGRDITDRKRVERELLIAAAAFESQEGIVVTDARNRILRVNTAFTRITGYSPEELIGRMPNTLKSGLHDETFYAAMWRDIQEKGGWQGGIWNRRKNGELYLERLTISVVKDGDGVVQHYVGMMTDITAEHHARTEALRLASFDPLTNLPNRTRLEEEIERVLGVASRDQRRGGIILVDLDNFGIINSAHGHKVGDELLCQAAARMELILPEGDTLARFSGDEFAILAVSAGTDHGSATEALNVLSKALRDALSQPYSVDGVGTILCTASIGVTLLAGRDEATANRLLSEAELAKLEVKSRGKNAVQFFEPKMQQELEERIVISKDLRAALKNGGLLLHYQPQVDRNGVPVGAEALVRWNHPQRGWMLPGQFIPIAEQSDLILHLGEWVLGEVCKQLAQWSELPGSADLTLAVNVSARQFRENDFAETFLRAVTASGANPTNLKLEITESMVMENIDDAVHKLGLLKERGVCISLDDFGTGNSSLSYLTRLPLDQLKIDRSFVQRLPDVRTDALIAQTIIGMAHGMRLEVIAEGVETEAQREFLSDHACDLFQGYLFGRPQPMADFEDFVTRSRGEAGRVVG